MDTSGSTYVGVAGGELDYGVCRDSIANMQTGPRDVVIFGRGTKGYEVRQKHLNNFLESDHEWLLLLDHDMTFPADTLARLKSHGRTFVSGYYMFRQVVDMRPIWFRPPNGDKWPLAPFLEDPERGRLHELGASGWGCSLMHRSCVEDVRALLKGEAEILEDDMDVWPYHLPTVLRCIDGIYANFDDADLVRAYADTLAQEFRPLRGEFDGGGRMVGSDVRFAWFARQAGHVLYGDPDVRCGHVTMYPVSPDDFTYAWSALTVERQEEIANEIGERMAAYWVLFDESIAGLR